METKCYFHPEQDASTTCDVCRRSYCASCVQVVDNEKVCISCTRSALKYLKYVNTPEYRYVSPAKAGWLAVIPMMGAIYNGTYWKALFQFFILVFIVHFFNVLNAEVVGVWGAIIFYGYTIVDAYRTAKQMQHGILTGEKSPMKQIGFNPILIGGFLMLAGVLFLLNNFGIDLHWFYMCWPVILVAAGIYLVFARSMDRLTGGLAKGKIDQQPPPPSPTAGPSDNTGRTNLNQGE